MEYRLIIKANDDTRILMTPRGVQIWMRGKRPIVKSFGCEVCGGLIGSEPFFIPIAYPPLISTLSACSGSVTAPPGSARHASAQQFYGLNQLFPNVLA
jgi:hypothetical protein